MYCQILSEAGSIREENQDYFLDSPDLGLMILSDGQGPKGAEAAEVAAKMIRDRVKSIYRLTLPAETERRLRSINETVQLDIAERFSQQKSSATWIAVWLLGETFSFISNGNFRFFFESPNSFKSLPAIGNSETPQTMSEVAITAKDFLILTSEGINLGMKELELSKLLCLKKLEAFHAAFSKCGNKYDGDDRTMVKVHIAPEDIKPFKTGDFVLSTEIDREFTFKIWQPLAILGGIGLTISLIGAKLAYSIKKKFLS